MRTFITILVLVSFVALAVNPKQAYEDDPHPGPDSEPHRLVTVDWDSHQIEVHSNFVMQGVDTMMKFDLDDPANSPLRMRTMYFKDSTDSSALINLGVSFNSIIEFHENNTVYDGYNSTQDTVVKQLKFDNGNWSDITAPTIGVFNGTRIWTFHVSYPHPTLPNVSLVLITIHFSERPFMINSTVYSPNEIKMDIILNNWTFVNSGDYIALEFRLQSRTARAYDHGVGDGQLSANEGNYFALFSWINDVIIDNILSQVIASQLEVIPPDPDPREDDGETANRIYFSFRSKSPKVIIWDPLVSVSGAGSVSGSSIIAASLLFALISMLISRF